MVSIFAVHNSGSVWKNICLVKSSHLFLRRFSSSSLINSLHLDFRATFLLSHWALLPSLFCRFLHSQGAPVFCPWSCISTIVPLRISTIFQTSKLNMSITLQFLPSVQTTNCRLYWNVKQTSPYFSLWHNIHNLKFTILTIFKYIVPWL